MYSYVGFVDGACIKSQGQACSAGLGGFILSKSRKVVLIFSEPCVAHNGFEAESEALNTLMGHLEHNPIGIHSCVIFSDSLQLINCVQKIEGVSWCRSLERVASNTFIQRVSFSFIPRHLNKSADSLAKESRSRNTVLAAWF